MGDFKKWEIKNGAIAYVGRGRMRSLTTATVLEQLGAKQREQIRRYREYVESIPAEGVKDEAPPTIKQMIIGDEEFAEQVLKKRPNTFG